MGLRILIFFARYTNISGLRDQVMVCVWFKAAKEGGKASLHILFLCDGIVLLRGELRR